MKSLKEYIDKESVNEVFISATAATIAGISAGILCMGLGKKVYTKLHSSGFVKQAKDFKEKYEDYRHRIEELLDKYPESVEKLNYLEDVNNQNYEELNKYGFWDKIAIKVEMMRWDRKDRKEFKFLLQEVQNMYNEIFKFIDINII